LLPTLAPQLHLSLGALPPFSPDMGVDGGAASESKDAMPLSGDSALYLLQRVSSLAAAALGSWLEPHQRAAAQPSVLARIRELTLSAPRNYLPGVALLAALLPSPFASPASSSSSSSSPRSAAGARGHWANS